MKKSIIKMTMTIMLFSLMFVGCNDDSEFVYRIKSISAYRYSPTSCHITLESNSDAKDYRRSHNVSEDFVVKINGEIIANASVSTGGIEVTGWDFWINAGDLFTVGQEYKIQVIYTANPDRKIYWVSNKDNNEYLLNSFDTGEKTVKAKLW